MRADAEHDAKVMRDATGRDWSVVRLVVADTNDKVPEAWTNLLAYVLQDELHNRLTPRVIDIAYTAFMQAKRPNDEDGGASDWFNDTRPKVRELIAKLRKDLIKELAGAQQPAQSPAAAQQGGVCDKAPAGWLCTRQHGHEGPCAAEPTLSARSEEWVEGYAAGVRDGWKDALRTQQAAPTAQAGSVTAPVNEAVAYLDIGAGGYIDLGTDLSEEALSRLPKGRHALTIAGTYGIDGYTPTTSADSVLEDAARWQELREQHESDGALCCVFAPDDMRERLVPVGSLPGELDAFMDAERAARKQGCAT